MRRRPGLLSALGVLAVLAGCHARVAAPEMVAIPAAEFVMGSDAKEFQIGRPAHRVRLKPFAIGKYEVTFDEYDAFARATQRALPDDHGWGRGRRPVIDVTWADSTAYAAWLAARTGRRFRLPSEAEWEYTAGGGAATDYAWGNVLEPGRLNVALDKGRDTFPFTAPVGSFPPNRLGVFDMAGNVFERVADCRHPDYADAPADGSAQRAAPCDDRVIRGGAWYSLGRIARLRARAAAPEAFLSSALGFRLAEDLP